VKRAPSCLFVISKLRSLSLNCRHYFLRHLIRRNKHLDTYHSFINQIYDKIHISDRACFRPVTTKTENIWFQNAGHYQLINHPRPTRLFFFVPLRASSVMVGVGSPRTSGLEALGLGSAQPRQAFRWPTRANKSRGTPLRFSAAGLYSRQRLHFKKRKKGCRNSVKSVTRAFPSLQFVC